MPKDTNSDFLKDFDRFGQPIGLTYKNNGSYNTPIGGVFTMIAFFIFMSWLAMECIDVYMPPGKHNMSYNDVVTQQLNGTWPVYTLDENSFLVTYKLQSMDQKLRGQEDKYFSGIWLQRMYDDVNGINNTVIKGKQCNDYWDPDDVSRMFTDNTRGFWCPDITNGTSVKLQNYSPSNYQNSTADFYFVLDTCEHLAKLTGKTDCVSEAESQAALEKMYVDTKIATQFWNSKNFLRNGHEMNTEFTPQRTQLTSAVFQRSAYYLRQNKITFRNNRFINVPYMPKWDPGQAY